MTAASDLLSRLQGRTLLVIGDLMLDHFVVGAVDRISPEAPVPVVRFDHESFRLGGAANVHTITLRNFTGTLDDTNVIFTDVA